ncbi:MAG TPA: FHA domain-containing protein [Gemmatimonadaceae bacterium]|nr:FHA domain-containing protein [Gemmatimonadaceae bacterium]
MPFLELDGNPDLADNPRELGADTVIGSGSQASWRVQGLDLAARHFSVRLNGDGAHVHPATAQSIVILNGEQVPPSGAAVKSGDLIAAGSARFVFLSDKSAKRPTMPTAAAQAYLIDAQQKKGYALRRRVVQIGREIGCSIVLRDPTVSRFHADVRSEGGQFVLYSMGSAGTRINDKNVGTPQMLKEGDLIQIGGTTFSFSKNPLPPGVRLVDLEDYKDDSFSRRSTQLYARTVTGEVKNLKSGRKLNPLVFVLIGMVLAMGVMYVIMR